MWKTGPPSNRIPDSKSRTQHAVCSCLEAERARTHVCVRARAAERKFAFVHERVQTTPFEARAAVRWGLGRDTQSLCWLAGNSISHIRAANHALFIPQPHKHMLSHLYIRVIFALSSRVVGMAMFKFSFFQAVNLDLIKVLPWISFFNQSN